MCGSSEGCLVKSQAKSNVPVKRVEDYVNCDFFREGFQQAYCGTEYETHLAVRNIIGPDDVVLEVGGR